MKTETIDHARDQAKAQFDIIAELMKNHRRAEKDNFNDSKEDDAENTREAIEGNALSIEVRSEWHTVASTQTPGQYKILLCTGGPAVRITGELDENIQPIDAKLEYQDWGTPWTEYQLIPEYSETLLAYAQQFYFGE